MCNPELVSRMRLRKQRQVKFWLDSDPTLPKYESYDQVPDSGRQCGLERPDFVWDCGTFKLVLEVDEDQHETRSCECEQVRMVNVTSSLGMPTFWVRYNPDRYKGEVKRVTETARCKYLLAYLRRALAGAAAPQGPEDACRVVYLFFDEFQMHVEPVVTRIPML